MIRGPMTEPRAISLSTAEPVCHDAGVLDREAEVAGVRWALVEYAPGAGRAGWCETPHSGYVVSGELSYAFEDGREPLVVGPGEAFVLPAEPRHRGSNGGTARVRLFIVDAIAAA
jgi:quercetin dioxygenase-like cupin family protein